MQAIDHRTITLPSGVRLDYAECGKGPATLFLHGYTDSWRSFEPVLTRMPGDVRSLAFSQRGHGDSDKPESFGIESLAADAVGFMDALGIDEAVVVGHSMGGLVAQEVALAHEWRVTRLVLVGTADTFDVPLARELGRAVGELDDPVPREFALEFQASTIHSVVSDDFLNMVVRESMKVPARIWRDALAAQVGFLSRDRLSLLTVPTLIVWGDHDQGRQPAL